MSLRSFFVHGCSGVAQTYAPQFAAHPATREASEECADALPVAEKFVEIDPVTLTALDQWRQEIGDLAGSGDVRQTGAQLVRHDVVGDRGLPIHELLGTIMQHAHSFEHAFVGAVRHRRRREEDELHILRVGRLHFGVPLRREHSQSRSRGGGQVDGCVEGVLHPYTEQSHLRSEVLAGQVLPDLGRNDQMRGRDGVEPRKPRHRRAEIQTALCFRPTLCLVVVRAGQHE